MLEPHHARRVTTVPQLLCPVLAAALSTRELTVLQLVARGYRRTQIAVLLGRTPTAVDHLIDQACQHLGTDDPARAVTEAVRRGLIV